MEKKFLSRLKLFNLILVWISTEIECVVKIDIDFFMEIKNQSFPYRYGCWIKLTESVAFKRILFDDGIRSISFVYWFLIQLTPFEIFNQRLFPMKKMFAV